MNRFVHWSFVVLAVVFSTASYAEEPKVLQKRSLEVGAVLSLTGIASANGQAIRDGIEFAKFELEKIGWDIKIKYDDDGTAPRQTVTAIKRLVAQGTKLFLGPTWGILSIPAAPVINGARAISLQPVNSSEFVEGVGDRYFFFYPPPSRATDLLIEFLRPYKGKKVAIFNNISPWGDLWTKIFTKACKEAGVELVATERIEFSEIKGSVPTMMTKFHQKGVEVILSTLEKEAEALSIRELETQRVRAQFLSLDLPDAVFDKLIGDKSSFVEGFSLVEKVDPEFVSSFEKWKGERVRRYSSFGYDALMALSAAVEAVGSDPEKVKGYFNHTLDIKGVSGQLKFDKSNNTVGSGYELKRIIERD